MGVPDHLQPPFRHGHDTGMHQTSRAWRRVAVARRSCPDRNVWKTRPKRLEAAENTKKANCHTGSGKLSLSRSVVDCRYQLSQVNTSLSSQNKIQQKTRQAGQRGAARPRQASRHAERGNRHHLLFETRDQRKERATTPQTRQTTRSFLHAKAAASSVAPPRHAPSSQWSGGDAGGGAGLSRGRQMGALLSRRDPGNNYCGCALGRSTSAAKTN